jgi:hypothetical protein
MIVILTLVIMVIAVVIANKAWTRITRRWES